MGSVVLLSGPIGAGKTTVAKELAALTPAPVSLIEGDVFWQFFLKSTEAQDRKTNFMINMGSMLAASLSFARGGYQVFIDFSIPPWFLEAAKRIVIGRGFELDYVVLLPSLETCARRAKTREEGAINDYEAVKFMHESFLKSEERSRIDTEHSDPKAIAQLIRAGLDAGTFRLT